MQRKTLDDVYVRTYVYRLYPNHEQRDLFMQYCGYRRFIWNKSIDQNKYMYDEYRYEKDYYAKVEIKRKNKDFCSPYPKFYDMKKEINAGKKQWEYKYPSKIALMAMTDFDNALSNFKNKAMPDWGHPKFRSRKEPRQGFKLPASSVKMHGRIIKLAKGQKDKKHSAFVLKSRQRFLDYPAGTVSFFTEKGRYYVAVPYYISKDVLLTGTNLSGRLGIDLNTKHYDTFDGKEHKRISIEFKKLNRHYKRIKHYQRMLAKKRNFCKDNINSKNYNAMRTKLQREYTITVNVQNDFLQKLTTYLCKTYKEIVIEDLDVKHMKMGCASKGMHRAMFGRFRQILTYKAEQYGVNLIVADRFYPSTQICSKCGFRKTGDEKITLYGNKKHHTKHEEYICYNCGAKMDRDNNSSVNLYNYPECQWLQDKLAQEKLKNKK